MDEMNASYYYLFFVRMSVYLTIYMCVIKLILCFKSNFNILGKFNRRQTEGIFLYFFLQKIIKFFKIISIYIFPRMLHVHYFPTSGDFCCLLIIFANSLDPDQARQNVGPDLDANCLSL